MFEELKIIVDMIAHLPTLAVWVLAGFLLYKLAIVGSIYGFLRFAIDKAYMAYQVKINKPIVRKEQEVDITAVLNGMVITHNGTHRKLLAQLERIKGKDTGIVTDYIHGCSVDWLRRAIDEAEARDFGVKADTFTRQNVGASGSGPSGGYNEEARQAK